MNIYLCETDEQIMGCYEVMSELRPHIEESDFLETVRRLGKTMGYQLVAASDDNDVLAAGGFRYGDSLAWGNYCYIDDLVTKTSTRSKGYGKALFDWIMEDARSKGCAELHLDSGVQRHQAHRFYLRERMDIVFYHFKRTL